MSHASLSASPAASLAQRINNFIVEALTVSMLIVGGLLTFVSVAAAS